MTIHVAGTSIARSTLPIRGTTSIGKLERMPETYFPNYF